MPVTLKSSTTTIMSYVAYIVTGHASIRGNYQHTMPLTCNINPKLGFGIFETKTKNRKMFMAGMDM